jgi:hypothetical protein
MYVWVNSTTGWVIHGKARISSERAEEVARLLERRRGWETAAGPAAPAPRPPRSGAPLPTETATSPAKFPGPTSRISLTKS